MSSDPSSGGEREGSGELPVEKDETEVTKISQNNPLILTVNCSMILVMPSMTLANQ